MSYDKEDTDNIESDMVEESHVRKVKKDAYHVAFSDDPGLIITTVHLKENDKDNNYAEWEKPYDWLCIGSPGVGERNGAPGCSSRGGGGATRGRGSSGRRSVGGTSYGAQRTNASGNGQGWANAATGLHGDSSGTSSINGRHASGGNSNGSNKFGNFPNLSHEQWSKLLTLLDNSNPTQTDALSGMETLWILDSGCSHHMTGRKDFF
ncbi:hypothetical protein M9H77_18980 [Catharanthus roseus]|uniref:Uncharacterized protein n=1 Tax=Catharanthus roseus TaxID=4058 RepID=A0ACC0B944_CATRO|nr:hypothetical protein M9H77_18980 [Catharanthus roseus]